MTTFKFEKKRAFLKTFNVAGFQYHEGSMVFDRLALGMQVYMQPDFDNRHDHNAIAIFYLNPKTEEGYQIGYVPRCENELLATFFEMGQDDVFELRIARLDPEAHYNQQVQVNLYLKKR